MLDAAFDEAGIDVEMQHRIRHITRIADAQLDIRSRVGRAPARDDRRQQVVADGQAGREPERCRQFIAEGLLHFTGVVKQGNRARQQAAAVGVEHQAFGGTVKQRVAKTRFELGQRHAGSRLRTRETVGGGAHTAFAGDGDEYVEVVQRGPHGVKEGKKED